MTSNSLPSLETSISALLAQLAIRGAKWIIAGLTVSVCLCLGVFKWRSYAETSHTAVSSNPTAQGYADTLSYKYFPDVAPIHILADTGAFIVHAWNAGWIKTALTIGLVSLLAYGFYELYQNFARRA